jgi:hypothetical protein
MTRIRIETEEKDIAGERAIDMMAQNADPDTVRLIGELLIRERFLVMTNLDGALQAAAEFLLKKVREGVAREQAARAKMEGLLREAAVARLDKDRHERGLSKLVGPAFWPVVHEYIENLRRVTQYDQPPA